MNYLCRVRYFIHCFGSIDPGTNKLMFLSHHSFFFFSFCILSFVCLPSSSIYLLSHFILAVPMHNVIDKTCKPVLYFLWPY